ncbi:hypothetical protein BJ085DRAFT_36479 [Dimargaris cristalligena]|uniref:Uncharacterized protein n=1 Tax=Dimargaris cristalligena TaxID=215637 RepID=A0A4P9ZPK2_9FUNG|nr:hypothetical protein BJ085DRAFT_36479 [Dimargaris cristalligena]|eukprot:RKP34611.1 hypothetical protein BJ085DRAFT_36479 [Dimargaris cristalligena]
MKAFKRYLPSNFAPARKDDPVAKSPTLVVPTISTILSPQTATLSPEGAVGATPTPRDSADPQGTAPTSPSSAAKPPPGFLRIDTQRRSPSLKLPGVSRRDSIGPTAGGGGLPSATKVTDNPVTNVAPPYPTRDRSVTNPTLSGHKPPSPPTLLAEGGPVPGGTRRRKILSWLPQANPIVQNFMQSSNSSRTSLAKSPDSPTVEILKIVHSPTSPTMGGEGNRKGDDQPPPKKPLPPPSSAPPHAGRGFSSVRNQPRMDTPLSPVYHKSKLNKSDLDVGLLHGQLFPPASATLESARSSAEALFADPAAPREELGPETRTGDAVGRSLTIIIPPGDGHRSACHSPISPYDPEAEASMTADQRRRLSYTRLLQGYPTFERDLVNRSRSASLQSLESVGSESGGTARLAVPSPLGRCSYSANADDNPAPSSESVLISDKVHVPIPVTQPSRHTLPSIRGASVSTPLVPETNNVHTTGRSTGPPYPDAQLPGLYGESGKSRGRRMTSQFNRLLEKPLAFMRSARPSSPTDANSWSGWWAGSGYATAARHSTSGVDHNSHQHASGSQSVREGKRTASSSSLLSSPASSSFVVHSVVRTTPRALSDTFTADDDPVSRTFDHRPVPMSPQIESAATMPLPRASRARDRAMPPTFTDSRSTPLPLPERPSSAYAATTARHSSGHAKIPGQPLPRGGSASFQPLPRPWSHFGGSLLDSVAPSASPTRCSLDEANIITSNDSSASQSANSEAWVTSFPPPPHAESTLPPRIRIPIRTSSLHSLESDRATTSSHTGSEIGQRSNIPSLSNPVSTLANAHDDTSAAPQPLMPSPISTSLPASEPQSSAGAPSRSPLAGSPTEPTSKVGTMSLPPRISTLSALSAAVVDTKADAMLLAAPIPKPFAQNDLSLEGMAPSTSPTDATGSIRALPSRGNSPTSPTAGSSPSRMMPPFMVERRPSSSGKTSPLSAVGPGPTRLKPPAPLASSSPLPGPLRIDTGLSRNVPIRRASDSSENSSHSPDASPVASVLPLLNPPPSSTDDDSNTTTLLGGITIPSHSTSPSSWRSMDQGMASLKLRVPPLSSSPMEYRLSQEFDHSSYLPTVASPRDFTPTMVAADALHLTSIPLEPPHLPPSSSPDLLTLGTDPQALQDALLAASSRSGALNLPSPALPMGRRSPVTSPRISRPPSPLVANSGVAPHTAEMVGVAPQPHSPDMLHPTTSGDNAAMDDGDAFLQSALAAHDQGDLRQSTHLFRQAALQGSSLGLFFYGIALRHGWGCKADPEFAFKCLQKAVSHAIVELKESVRDTASTLIAKQELAIALYELAVCFQNGWGVRSDLSTAAFYFELSADLGDADAQNDIAFCYLNGRGGPRR